jgi:hypothetical protein
MASTGFVSATDAANRSSTPVLLWQWLPIENICRHRSVKAPTDAFKHGFESPEFQAQLKQYPARTGVSASMFRRVAVPGMCLGEPVVSD